MVSSSIFRVDIKFTKEKRVLVFILRMSCSNIYLFGQICGQDCTPVSIPYHSQQTCFRQLKIHITIERMRVVITYPAQRLCFQIVLFPYSPPPPLHSETTPRSLFICFQIVLFPYSPPHPYTRKPLRVLCTYCTALSHNALSLLP